MGWGLLKGLGQGMQDTAKTYQAMVTEEKATKRADRNYDLELKKMEQARQNHLKQIVGATAEGVPVTQGQIEGGYSEPVYRQGQAPTEEAFINPETGETSMVLPGKQEGGLLSKGEVALKNQFANVGKDNLVEVVNPKTGDVKRVPKNDVPEGYVSAQMANVLRKGDDAASDLKESDKSKLLTDINKTLKNAKGKPIVIGKKYSGDPPANLSGQSLSLLNSKMNKAGLPGFKIERVGEDTWHSSVKWRVVEIPVETPEAQPRENPVAVPDATIPANTRGTVPSPSTGVSGQSQPAAKTQGGQPNIKPEQMPANGKTYTPQEAQQKLGAKYSPRAGWVAQDGSGGWFKIPVVAPEQNPKGIPTSTMGEQSAIGNGLFTR